MESVFIGSVRTCELVGCTDCVQQSNGAGVNRLGRVLQGGGGSLELRGQEEEVVHGINAGRSLYRAAVPLINPQNCVLPNSPVQYVGCMWPSL